jgi:hypothetical protein
MGFMGSVGYLFSFSYYSEFGCEGILFFFFTIPWRQGGFINGENVLLMWVLSNGRLLRRGLVRTGSVDSGLFIGHLLGDDWVGDSYCQRKVARWKSVSVKQMVVGELDDVIP